LVPRLAESGFGFSFGRDPLWFLVWQQAALVPRVGESPFASSGGGKPVCFLWSSPISSVISGCPAGTFRVLGTLQSSCHSWEGLDGLSQQKRPPPPRKWAAEVGPAVPSADHSADKAFQLPCPNRVAKLPNRFCLDLPHSFPGNMENPPNFLQGIGESIS
jgi:hypothetical protein